MHVPPARGVSAGRPPAQGWAEPSHRISGCAIEVEVPWRALQCLTPDAMQLADSEWAPAAYPSATWRTGAAAAREGLIAPLKLLTMDVQMAPSDGAARYCCSRFQTWGS